MDKYLEDELPDDASEEEDAKPEKHPYHSIEVSCLLLVTMSSKLQKRCENLGVYNMYEHLKDMFHVKPQIKRFKVMQLIIGCKKQENGYVSTHVIKLKVYFHRLDCLGFPFTIN